MGERCVLQIILIAALLLCAIAGWGQWRSWRRSRRHYRSLTRIDFILPPANYPPTTYKRIPREPEEHYIEGLGYVIGDASCRYNACSPYIRCAVNPSGLCEGCRDYSP
jgi:hypothetical protein